SQSEGGENSPETGENHPQGAQLDGHPGAQPRAGTGAQPYVGTNNASSERPHIESQRRAREADPTVRFLRLFETLWPTASVDDRHRTAYAAEALSEPERKAALDGIVPFLENLKRLGRKTYPAG